MLFNNHRVTNTSNSRVRCTRILSTILKSTRQFVLRGYRGSCLFVVVNDSPAVSAAHVQASSYSAGTIIESGFEIKDTMTSAVVDVYIKSLSWLKRGDIIVDQ